MSSMIGRAALELARETGIFPAAVFVGLMGLFVYALWEYFPGYPEAAEQGDSGGTPGSSDRSVRFAARDDATNTEDMSA